MTPIQRRFLTISCLALGGLLAAACAKARQAPQEAIHVDSGTATFTEMIPGVTQAVLWGDPDTGPHAGFVKFAAGQQNPLHTHTNDIHIVVLSGAYLYRPENGPEQRIAAGHFLFLPGGDRHFSGGDATEGALFYSESPGRFDLNPVQ
jgi:hypothetical protein